MRRLKDIMCCISATYHVKSNALSFTIDGKKYKRKLHEEYCTNFPLQWVVVNNEKLLASLDTLDFYKSYD